MALAHGNEASIYYEIHGSTGSPVVMSAGMGGSGQFWAPQIAALSTRHRVLIYDHVGTGRSTREPPAAHSIADMAADVMVVMDAAGFDDAHFAGHAIGGIVGLELALLAPKRLRSLLLANAWARADSYLRRCFEVRKEILRSSGPEAYVHAQPLFLYPPRFIAENDVRLRDEAKHMVASFPSVAFMLQRIEMFLAFDAGERFAGVPKPTLVVSSSDDSLVPSYLSVELAAAIRGARHVEIACGAHAFTAVAPDRFNHLALDFWAALDRSARV